jgi:branched-chain amino acid aminotransferase
MTTDTLDFKINPTTNSRINELDKDNIQFGKMYSDHMFVADYENGEWTNMEIMPYQDLPMSPANAALHYGQSIFEGLKAYKNESGEVLIFRPTDNAKRMNVSAQRMCMPEFPEALFMTVLKKLLDLDSNWVPDGPGTSLYIRPVMFANDPFVGIRPSHTFKYIIFTSPAGPYYNEPVNVKIETEYTRAVKGGVGYAKTAGNYAASLYPAKLAQDKGYHQLIWTDGINHEYVEEAGTMNLMFVFGDTLVTAPTGDSILNGITRDSVLRLAKDWGMKIEQRKISIKEVIEGLKSGQLKEAFGCGTAASIAPIKTIGHEGTDYNLAKEMPVSNKFFTALNDIKTGRLEDNWEWVYKV